MIKNTRVLVVEDEAIVGLDLKRKLTSLGVKITGVCATYSAALESLETEPPDMIFLDIGLKGEQNGIDLARTINEKYKLPFIFLTARSDCRTIEDCVSLQPYGFIRKPFVEKDLLVSIEMAMHRLKTEKILKDIKREYQDVLLKSLIINIDRYGNIKSINNVFLSEIGYEAEEVIGKQIWEFFPPECCASAKMHWKKLTRDKKIQVNNRLICKNGNYINVSGFAELMYMPDGERQILITINKVNGDMVKSFIYNHEEIFEKLFELLPNITLSTERK